LREEWPKWGFIARINDLVADAYVDNPQQAESLAQRNGPDTI
jgi:hypothetical protein